MIEGRVVEADGASGEARANARAGELPSRAITHDSVEILVREGLRLASGLAVVGLVFGVVNPGEHGVSLVATSGEILLLALMAWLWRQTIRSGPLSLVELMLIWALVAPAALVIATIVFGDAVYDTARTWFSHHDKGEDVALARVAFYGTAFAGAVTAATFPRRSAKTQTRENERPRRALEDLSRIALWPGVVLVASRLWLIGAAEDVSWWTYGARVASSQLQSLHLLVGVAAAKGRRWAWPTTVLLGVATTLSLLGGNRFDNLFGICLWCAGWVIVRPISQKTVRLLAPPALAAFVGLVWVLGVIRDDGMGRDLRAGLSRLESAGGVVEAFGENTSRGERPLARFISTSTHSVLTRVPQEVPFDSKGLSAVPREFVEAFLPRFYREKPIGEVTSRNRGLNDLGFLVTWETSVELETIADAWWRGGWSGLLLVGLAVGLSFGAVDRVCSFRRESARPFQLVGLFLWAAVPQMLWRDIVAAVRMGVQLSIAAVLFWAIAWAWQQWRVREATPERERARLTRRGVRVAGQAPERCPAEDRDRRRL